MAATGPAAAGWERLARSRATLVNLALFRTFHEFDRLISPIGVGFVSHFSHYWQADLIRSVGFVLHFCHPRPRLCSRNDNDSNTL
jgi:hypothetical protein